MANARAITLFIVAVALMATVDGSSARGAEVKPKLPKGAKGVLFTLDKDRGLPPAAEAGMLVDVIGEMNDQTQTAIAILGVELLVLDPKLRGGEQPIVVQLLPAQLEVFELMRRHRLKLSVRVRMPDQHKR